jgi:hypothetical protein
MCYYSIKVVMSMFLECILMMWSFKKVIAELKLFGDYTDWQIVTVRHTFAYMVIF